MTEEFLEEKGKKGVKKWNRKKRGGRQREVVGFDDIMVLFQPK